MAPSVPVEDCKLLDLPTVEDPLGDLSFAEGERHLPFSIARVYHVHGVPAGARRGGHAHRLIEQVVICLGGSFTVALDDGARRRTVTLDDPRRGLYLAPMVWHDLTGFAADSTYYVVASGRYDEREYIRDHDEFLALAANR